MNAQFKKGVLELIVLESVRQRDMYGYELVEEVSKVVDVNEGTIYPLLANLGQVLLIHFGMFWDRYYFARLFYYTLFFC